MQKENLGESVSVHEKFLGTYKKISFIYPILAAVIAIAYFLALKSDFDTTIGHFERGSIWFYIFSGAIVIAVVISAILSKLSEKKVSVISYPGNGPLPVFASIFGALMAVMLLVSSAADLSKGVLDTFGKYAAYLVPFIALSLILSLSKKTAVGPIRSICAALGAVSVNLSMFESYFDFSIPLNSPVRNLTTIANTAVLLFLFSEARLTFKMNERRVLTPFYIFSCMTTASIALGISCGAILSKIFAPIVGDPNLSMYRLAMYAAIGLLAISRVFALPKIGGKYVEPPKNDKNAKKLNKNTETDQTDKE